MDSGDSGLSSLTPAQRAQLVDQMKTEVAIASARELIEVCFVLINMHRFQQMTQKCFEKCVTRPGTSLDNSEQKCVGNCMDRYMDSVNLITKVFATRLQQEAAKMQGLS
ncbi:unnamed protein product [Dibothriocephalus latus]|uniref:Mitochondrial import inner membrane translocase subunit n=1 Tax=Dibothriocephalus latus TaxID=60516 RepID=A0A3P7L8C7_DIBLA|nr:unnamed protein product [Dibothriocephalus latus]